MTEDKDRQTSTLIPAGQGLKLRTHKIRIEVLDGKQAGRVIELDGPDARIGSGPHCEFQIDDGTVSWHHLTLRIEGEKVRLIDVGSRNGTTVDGVPVRDAYARPDSSIRVGKTVLGLRMVRKTVELPVSKNDRFGALLGSSIVMRKVFALLEKAAESDDTVLLEGETGTGKELAARGIHDGSSRKAGPFVVLDCSTISAEVVESELFGHVKGSFTGALVDRPGIFEEARGGTLFIDEIGELPQSLQSKLLRVLETFSVRRVGANKPYSVDVRVVAATNRSLSQDVNVGLFRADLFHRLAVIQIRLPPLSERPEDIPILVKHFVEQRAAKTGTSASLPPHVVDDFSALAWPGNVRELRNAVARAFTLGISEPPSEVEKRSSELDAETLGISLDEPLLEGRERIAQAYEKIYISLALQKTQGNVSRAAEVCGVSRKFVQAVMKRHGLRGLAGT